MSHITDDRVLESTTTTGTGALTLAGALTGFRAFGAVMTSPSDTCFYVVWAVDGNGNPTGDWEEGLGTYSAANTLTRTTVRLSTNSNNAVSLAAGTKYVAITAQAARVLQFDNELAVPMAKATVASVTAPPADTLKFYNRSLAQRQIPSWKGPVGEAYRVQPALWSEEAIMYTPLGPTTQAGTAGLGTTWTANGTISHPTPSTGVVSQIYRTRLANVVTTQNQVLGVSNVSSGFQRYQRGNASKVGGFFFFCRFIVELIPAATVRIFVGLTDQTTNPLTSDTLAGNCIGLWHDTTDGLSVLSLVTRDGTTATKTAVTLTGNLAAGQGFDFTMWCGPNQSTVGYRVDDLNAGTILADTTISTTLPTNTAIMAAATGMSNGTVNTTVTTTAFGIAKLWIAKDF